MLKGHYNYFRDYDASLGRYIESDPIGLKGGLSTYLYGAGRPPYAVDPKGLHPCFKLEDCMGQAKANYHECETTYRPALACVFAYARCALLRHPIAILACLIGSSTSCAGSYAVCLNQWSSDLKLCNQGIGIGGYMPGENYGLDESCPGQCYSRPEYKGA